MDGYLLQFIFISVGIILIIIALFRTKKSSEVEEMIEKMFEDFIMQIDLENEDMINKIKMTTQNKLPFEIATKINTLEQQINVLELELKNIKSVNNEDIVEDRFTPSVNKKYIEVLNLYKEGHNIEYIVEKTNITHAEIKFVLELSSKDFNYVKE